AVSSRSATGQRSSSCPGVGGGRRCRPGPDMLGRIREIENVFIPMPDGVRLAARLFLPVDSDDNPVPDILEYIPYRKRDLMRARDEPIHRYFAAHGYASVRVDVRGSGDSDGLLEDE